MTGVATLCVIRSLSRQHDKFYQSITPALTIYIIYFSRLYTQSQYLAVDITESICRHRPPPPKVLKAEHGVVLMRQVFDY